MFGYFSCETLDELYKSYEEEINGQNLISQLFLGPGSLANYGLVDGLLNYKWKLLVGSANDIRKQLITSIHDSRVQGHSSERGSFHRLQSIFYWKGMRKDVIQYVRSCDICQRFKFEHVAYPGLFHNLPISE